LALILLLAATLQSYTVGLQAIEVLFLLHLAQFGVTAWNHNVVIPLKDIGADLGIDA
jgi:hypothetical protein